MDTELELEIWKSLQYRIREEGMDYCFNGYSNWDEIDDNGFHELRNFYINIGRDLQRYTLDKINELENKDKDK